MSFLADPTSKAGRHRREDAEGHQLRSVAGSSSPGTWTGEEGGIPSVPPPSRPHPGGPVVTDCPQ